MYNEGMYCKHFKGSTLLEKNIYQIIGIRVDPNSIDFSNVTYSGDHDVMSATDLVLYANIFQDNKLFVREESDISGVLTEDKQREYNQVHKVEPLTPEETELIFSEEFIKAKKAYESSKTR